MSDTPRTECYVLNPQPSVVPAEFARELERDVIRLQSVVANLFVALERIKDGSGSPEVNAFGDIQTGLHCGVEDIMCSDRYDGADYGYSQGVERALEWASNEAASALDKIKL